MDDFYSDPDYTPDEFEYGPDLDPDFDFDLDSEPLNSFE